MGYTIRDIAKAAGVSPTTVSLILNHKESRISEKTKQRILSIAKEYNYQPNRVAVSLVTRKTHIIGLIHPDMNNLFYSALSSGVERNAQKNGYNLIICNSGNDVARCAENVSVLESRQVDGIIIQPPESINATRSNYTKIQQILNDCSVPYIILDRAIHDVYHDYIACDHQYGGFLATSHLVNLGHKHIGCITGPMSDYGVKRRISGYKEVLAESGIEYDQDLIYVDSYSTESGYAGAKQLIEKGVSAIFAFSDLIALGVQRAAMDLGISIPNELSLIGYDDSPIAVLSPVPLTTIRQPIDLMGKHACETLLNRIKTPDRPQQDYYFTPTLIERKSCSPYS